MAFKIESYYYYVVQEVLMEVARLADEDVNIHTEWFGHIAAGTLNISIIRQLEAKYRIHSKKKAFHCLCCQQPVSLVLRNDSPHFRHEGKPCPSGANYTRYISHNSSSENQSIHRAGRAILRTYLEGQLKPHQIDVQDGYMFKILLKIVPDFILTFPDGSLWAIDYVTGSRQNESYYNYIKKRAETYKAAGFHPIFLIDSSWLAEVPDRPIVSLYLAENQMKNYTSMDEKWTEFVIEFFDAFGVGFVLREWFNVNFSLYSESKVFSLIYVNPIAGTATVQRFIPATGTFGLNVHRTNLSLEEASSLNEKKTGFRWWEESETDRMQERLQELALAYEAEQKRLVDEAEQHRLNQLKKTRRVQVNFSRETSLMPIGVSKKEKELIQILTNKNISVSEASSLYLFLKNHKSQITKGTMDYIRNQCRDIMGTIQNPNPIAYGLRTVLINIAFL
jgi:hypothetical protein